MSKSSPTKHEEEEARRLLASVLFGVQKEPTAAPHRSSHNSSDIAGIDGILPPDPEELRKTAIYKSTYRLLQWQRDNYLVGRPYADWKKEQRDNDASASASTATTSNSSTSWMTGAARSWLSFNTMANTPLLDLPVDPSALSHGQVARLAASFIPSSTVQQTLLPLVTPLPTTVLQPIASDAIVRVLAGQQENVSRLMRNAVLGFLDNPDYRNAMKQSTQGFLASATEETTQ